MSIKTLFTIGAVITGLLGVAWLFAPSFMLADWGLPDDAATVYMARRCGAMFFGYSTILWVARGASASPARRAIVTGGLVLTLVLTAVTLVGVLGGTIGPRAWIVVVIEALLAAGFGYHLTTDRS
ncbi:MAG: hypothetical protein NTV05_05805 [Acidobacteria bacterium]|nr:hypothetical protein [Acidobacteriota bacterium]